MHETSSSDPAAVPAARGEAPRLFWWLVLLAASAFYIVFILRTGFTVYGERYYTLFDDAMISMRYAQNLAAGHGLVWNPGEAPVEGYTNLLWTLWMAAIHLLPLPLAKTSLVVMASGALILLAQSWVVAATARVLTGVRRSWAGLFAVFLTAFSYPMIYWTLRGMEVGFLALLASAGALFAFRLQEERRPAFFLGLSLCLAALVLTRDDAVTIAGVLAAYAFFTAPSWRSRWGTAALLGTAVVVPKAIHLAFRRSFYGDFLPNTYYLKLGGSTLADRVGRGAMTFGAAVTQQFLPLLVVAALLLVALRRGSDPRQPRLRWRLFLLAALVLVQSAYSVYVGGDAWEYMRMANRYVAIALPALALLAGLGLARLGEAGGPQPRTLGVLVGLGAVAGGLWNLGEKVSENLTSPRDLAWGITLAVTGAALAGLFRLSPRGANAGAWARTDRARIAWVLTLWALVNGKETLQWVTDNAYELPMNIQRTRVGLLIRESTDPEARIAVAAAGSTPYFAERPTVDVLGKCDRRIARMPRTEAFMPGHDKQDYAYSFGTLRPDLVVDYFNPKPDARQALKAFGFERLPNGIHVRRSTSRVRRDAISRDFDSYGLPAVTRAASLRPPESAR
jgi:arabinofuranosyltransferase